MSKAIKDSVCECSLVSAKNSLTPCTWFATNLLAKGFEAYVPPDPAAKKTWEIKVKSDECETSLGKSGKKGDFTALLYASDNL